jgi:sec-independent protein translocase protein TatA
LDVYSLRFFKQQKIGVVMGIGLWELVLLLLIVLVLFGTKRLRNVGGDLGAAIKSFKSAMKEPEAPSKSESELEENTDTKNSQPD